MLFAAMTGLVALARQPLPAAPAADPADPATAAPSAMERPKMSGLDQRGRARVRDRWLGPQGLRGFYAEQSATAAVALQDEALVDAHRAHAWAWGGPVGGALLGLGGGIAWGFNQRMDQPRNGYYNDEGTYQSLCAVGGGIVGGVGGALLGLGVGIGPSLHFSRSASQERSAAANSYRQHRLDDVKAWAFPLRGGAQLGLRATF
jgi:hypothetical protein